MNKKDLIIYIILAYLLYNHFFCKETFSLESGKIPGNLSIDGNLYVKGGADIKKTLGVHGMLYGHGGGEFDGNLDYSEKREAIINLNKLAKNLTKDGKLVVPGGLEVKGQLTVSNTSTFGTKRPLKIIPDDSGNDTTYLVWNNDTSNEVYIQPTTDGKIVIRGDTTFNNNLLASGITANRGVDIGYGFGLSFSNDGKTQGQILPIKNGGMQLTNNTRIEGNLTVDNNLYVNGAANITKTLGVQGKLNAHSDLHVKGNVGIKAEPNRSYPLTMNGDLYVKGNVGIKAKPNGSYPLTMNGDASVNHLSADSIWSYGNIKAEGKIKAEQ